MTNFIKRDPVHPPIAREFGGNIGDRQRGSVLDLKSRKYADWNWLVWMTMSGITASLRFSGEPNGDLRKMGVNLVPFPRLHFFLLAQPPLFARGQEAQEKLTVQELTNQM